MEEFVAYIIKNLVSFPADVNVSSYEDGDRLKIEIHVAQDDVGKIIGRKGNTINALRTIVRTVATRLGRKVQVELIQADKPEQSMIETAEPEDNMIEVEEADSEEHGCSSCARKEQEATVS